MFLLKGSYENEFCGIRKMFLKSSKIMQCGYTVLNHHLKTNKNYRSINCSNHLKILFNDIILPKTI